MKRISTEIKNSADGFNHGLDTVKERITKLGDRVLGITLKVALRSGDIKERLEFMGIKWEDWIQF